MEAQPQIIPTPFTAESATKALEGVSKRTGIEYTDIAIVLGTKDKNGVRQETVHVIDCDVVDISKVILAVEEKMRACKNEEGNIVGYEPSGEVNLKLEVKYFQP